MIETDTRERERTTKLAVRLQLRKYSDLSNGQSISNCKANSFVSRIIAKSLLFQWGRGGGGEKRNLSACQISAPPPPFFPPETLQSCARNMYTFTIDRPVFLLLLSFSLHCRSKRDRRGIVGTNDTRSPAQFLDAITLVFYTSGEYPSLEKLAHLRLAPRQYAPSYERVPTCWRVTWGVWAPGAQRKYCLRGKRRCGARGHRCRAEVLSRSPGVFDRSSPTFKESRDAAVYANRRVDFSYRIFDNLCQ